MITKGLVVNTEKDRCEVLVFREEACGSCASCGEGCSASRPTKYWIANALDAELGDEVTLEVENRRFFFSIFHLYVLPLLLFLGGILGTAQLLVAMHVQSELLAFLGGLVGLGIYSVIARLTNRKVAERMQVRMIAKQKLSIESTAA
uniref:SoxR reducing system RseC family protein n=1 Tax=Ndongobacter massiliensis TaxID=1871025 RepID=UPI00093119DB|nr:SoxR reducing system RseC family protein [Ndongobacter massiliensis]